MPKQLNNGQVTQALQRAFGFKGRYIPSLDEVIVPVYVIADPSPAAATKLAAGTVTVVVSVGGLGDRPWGGIFNVIGSGNVLNVTNVVILSEIKQPLVIRLFDDPDDIGTERPDVQFRDRRNGGKPTAIVKRFDDTTAVGDQGLLIAQLEVDGSLSQTASWETQSGDPRQPLAVLPEGRGLIVQTSDNQTGPYNFRINFRWLEVPRTETRPAGGLP